MKSKILQIVNALFFAVLLWLLITLNQQYSISFTLPLELKIKEYQALAEELPNHIEITAKGKGWDLISLYFSKNLSYNLDLTGVRRDVKINTLQSVYEKVSLPSSIIVTNVSPDTLDISFDNLIQKYVKVKNNITVIPKQGYMIIGTPKLSQDSVKISGASSIVSKLKFIPTEKKVFENVSGEFTRNILLSDSLSGLIKIEPANLRITYLVELSADKKLEDVRIIVNNVPGDVEVLLIPPNINIAIRGGVDELSRFTSQDIKVSVEYSLLEKDTLGFVTPKFELPSTVSLMNFTPDKFQFIIKKKIKSGE